MARKKTMIPLDEELLRKLQIAANRNGKNDHEIIEAALRRYLDLDVADRVWQRSAAHPVASEDAMATAYRELDAMRAEREPPR